LEPSREESLEQGGEAGGFQVGGKAGVSSIPRGFTLKPQRKRTYPFSGDFEVHESASAEFAGDHEVLHSVSAAQVDVSLVKADEIVMVCPVEGSERRGQAKRAVPHEFLNIDVHVEAIQFEDFVVIVQERK
jgi:hypothetical protein